MNRQQRAREAAEKLQKTADALRDAGHNIPHTRHFRMQPADTDRLRAAIGEYIQAAVEATNEEDGYA